MKNTKSKAAENRDRIIAEAATQFRARGFSGIGVADLMRRAGLTHGGFYAHFSSKEELMDLACRRAVGDMLADWRARAANAPDDALGAIVRHYLSPAHRDHAETGCLMAALGPEAAREVGPVRQTVTECLAEVLDTLAGLVPLTDPAERRKHAIMLFSLLVGSLVVARAAADVALSDEVLRTVSEDIPGHYIPAAGP